MNQNPEQLARDKIYADLMRCSWLIQPKSTINLNPNLWVAVRPSKAAICPANYLFFVNIKTTSIIAAKREEKGEDLTMHEVQSDGYAKAKRILSRFDTRHFVEQTGQEKFIDLYPVLNQSLNRSK